MKEERTESDTILTQFTAMMNLFYQQKESKSQLYL